MKIIYNNIIPFGRFFAINLFGVVFVKGKKGDFEQTDWNHEMIHTAQMKELWYLPFYIIYVLEWFIRLFGRGNAYSNISFEREAYFHEYNDEYLSERPRFAQWRSKKKWYGK